MSCSFKQNHKSLDRDYPQLAQVGSVFVYVNKKTTLQIVQTATVTILDMISNIGGTLGLFCGVSILSVVEALYWAGLIFLAKFQSKKD